MEFEGFYWKKNGQPAVSRMVGPSPRPRAARGSKRSPWTSACVIRLHGVSGSAMRVEVSRPAMPFRRLAMHFCRARRVGMEACGFFCEGVRLPLDASFSSLGLSRCSVVECHVREASASGGEETLRVAVRRHGAAPLTYEVLPGDRPYGMVLAFCSDADHFSGGPVLRRECGRVLDVCRSFAEQGIDADCTLIVES